MKNLKEKLTTSIRNFLIEEAREKLRCLKGGASLGYLNPKILNRKSSQNTLFIECLGNSLRNLYAMQVEGIDFFAKILVLENDLYVSNTYTNHIINYKNNKLNLTINA